MYKMMLILIKTKYDICNNMLQMFKWTYDMGSILIYSENPDLFLIIIWGISFQYIIGI